MLIPFIGVALLIPAFAFSTAPTADGCNRGSQSIAGCPNVAGSINDENAILNGSDRTSPGTPPPSRPGPAPAAPPVPERDDPTAFAQRTDELGFLFNVQIDRLCTDPTIVTCAEVEPVTMADLASFRPNTGTTHMEPNGWTIAGLPTNFWITATPHTLTGTLLDLPATVHFTPVAARFSYGDNTPTVRTPLGTSWNATGVDEFTPTPTSHIYRTTGTYTVTPSIDFTVQYSYNGNDWIPIDGILTATATPLTATIVRATTVLVSGDCTTTPTGPGC